LTGGAVDRATPTVSLEDFGLGDRQRGMGHGELVVEGDGDLQQGNGVDRSTAQEQCKALVIEHRRNGGSGGQLVGGHEPIVASIADRSLT